MIQLVRAFLISLLALLSVASAHAQTVQVYELPPGARPHDVAPAQDGKVWYTAQGNGKLGILDPQTGAAREVPLGPKSSPHGVIQGPDGAAWITDSGQNAIVRFDPKTEEIKVWRLPEDVGYANLNTAAFDKDGIHWFTGQNGIYGRLCRQLSREDRTRDRRGQGDRAERVVPKTTMAFRGVDDADERADLMAFPRARASRR